jgi:hypothetical protein
VPLTPAVDPQPGVDVGRQLLVVHARRMPVAGGRCPPDPQHRTPRREIRQIWVPRMFSPVGCCSWWWSTHPVAVRRGAPPPGSPRKAERSRCRSRLRGDPR